MKKTPKTKRPVSAETIAREASQGKDVSRYFDASKGRMVYPSERTEERKVSKETRRPRAA